MMNRTVKIKGRLNEDPTRTSTLRSKAVSEINRRYREIKKLITQSVRKNRIFANNVEALQKSDFAFEQTPEQMEHFQAWLLLALQALVLTGDNTVNSAQLNWLMEYIQESYYRGATKGNNELAAILGRDKVPKQISILDNPFHRSKLQVIISRDFTQLKGIDAAMSQQIDRVLSEALLEGYSPLKTARLMNDRVDKIGITRSRLLARTEIIYAHNVAKITEGQRIQETIGEEIVYEWITSGDTVVRPTHVQRNRKYYSFSRVMGLLGEPNCRCAIALVPISRLPKGRAVHR